MNGLAALWEEISDVTWIANVGLPTAATMAAVLVAFLILRSQMRHDRQLLHEQRRANAATVLSQELRSVRSRLDDVPFGDLQSLPADWSLPTELFRATQDALVVLGPDPALNLVDDLARDLSHRRDVCSDLALQSLDQAAGWAFYNTLAPTTARLEELAMKLARWDGRGRLPSLTSIEIDGWERVPLPAASHSEEFRQWRNVVKAEYQHNLEELSGAFDEAHEGGRDVDGP